ncbi:MAG: DUF6370 family protein [Pirellulaceae bacterium]
MDRQSNRFGLVAALAVLLFFQGCSTTVTQTSNPNELVDREVELSCGECQFKMQGSGCDLAIRVDGRAYYVDGSSIDDHGNAHAADGLCNAIRKAKATGTIKGDRFLATKLELLPK